MAVKKPEKPAETASALYQKLQPGNGVCQDGRPTGYLLRAAGKALQKHPAYNWCINDIKKEDVFWSKMLQSRDCHLSLFDLFYLNDFKKLCGTPKIVFQKNFISSESVKSLIADVKKEFEPRKKLVNQLQPGKGICECADKKCVSGNPTAKLLEHIKKQPKNSEQNGRDKAIMGFVCYQPSLITDSGDTPFIKFQEIKSIVDSFLSNKNR